MIHFDLTFLDCFSPLLKKGQGQMTKGDRMMAFSHAFSFRLPRIIQPHFPKKSTRYVKRKCFSPTRQREALIIACHEILFLLVLSVE